MNTLDLLMTATALPVVAAGSYLASLSLLARRPQARRTAPNAQLRWCVVVPAHNEASGIGETLQSLASMTYPRDRVQVLVIADNCTDETATRARHMGALVLERQDADLRGKGYALQYAFRWLQDSPTFAWDAVLVVDADSIVTPDLLHACSAAIEAGADAAQVLYLAREPRGRAAASDMVHEVALRAFHDVRSLARARLGLSAGLRGNGMAFTRSILRDVPYAAFTLAEDVEYGITLGLHGVAVAFVGDAIVRGDMPTHRAASDTQGRRWIAGRALLLKQWSRILWREARRQRSLLLLDLLIDLLIPPLSLLVAVTAVGFLASTILSLSGHAVPVAMALWSWAVIAVGCHVVDAARRAQALSAPLALIAALTRHLTTRVRHLFHAAVSTDQSWQRTPRTDKSSC